MKCKICNDNLDVEHPDSIKGKNPITFRNAWMHYICHQWAYEDLSKDQKDKYNNE